MEAVSVDFQKIKYFLSVAERKSFTIAAEKNSISQQALSKHIGDLEYELGCRLFDRSKNPVTLTLEGQFLLPDATKILTDKNIFLSHARSISKTCTGELRIGYGGYWEYSWLIQTVSNFSRDFPYTNFSFTREHHGQ